MDLCLITVYGPPDSFYRITQPGQKYFLVLDLELLESQENHTKGGVGAMEGFL